MKAKVVHPSMRHVSNSKLNDTAIVFTNASRLVGGITRFIPGIKNHVGAS
jgi:hypothetical protein